MTPCCQLTDSASTFNLIAPFLYEINIWTLTLSRLHYIEFAGYQWNWNLKKKYAIKEIPSRPKVHHLLHRSYERFKQQRFPINPQNPQTGFAHSGPSTTSTHFSIVDSPNHNNKQARAIPLPTILSQSCLAHDSHSSNANQVQETCVDDK